MNTHHRIIIGDCMEGMAGLPDGSVHCCITSPPYWGLRDYGTAEWDGGDPECDHVYNHGVQGATGQRADRTFTAQAVYRDTCRKCGARRIDQQLGLEATPDEFVAKMVEVFREVRRVLRDDGTLWLNLGDSYSSGGRDSYGTFSPDSKQASHAAIKSSPRPGNPPGLKPKDLCGIPWRVALALQADGWVLRQEIVWSKPNPMPESVTDRCTKAHEQVFLFAKATWSGPEPGRFADMSDSDARVIATAIDTEGNICIKRCRREGQQDHYGVQVAMAGTSRAMLEHWRAIVGYGSLNERQGVNAPVFYWQVTNRVARDLLHRVYPFLIVKRRQARIGMYLQSLLRQGGKVREDRDTMMSLWERNKACNRFGDPDLSDVPEPKYGRWSGCATYYYDAEAIKEAADPSTQRSEPVNATMAAGNMTPGNDRRINYEKGRHVVYTRNRRSVWTVPTAPYSEAHFATYPPKLIEPMILAGTSAKGCCPQCGAPWERVVERSGEYGSYHNHENDLVRGQRHEPGRKLVGDDFYVKYQPPKTTGWQPTCTCGGEPVPCTVLDPFGGSGTTAAVANLHGRNAILCELNPAYAAMAERRIGQAVRPDTYRDESKADDAPLFMGVSA